MHYVCMTKRNGIDRVAGGTPEALVDFAVAQVFGPAERVAPRPAEAPARDLQRVIRELHQSEINVGLATFWDAGFRVWIGDELNGHC